MNDQSARKAVISRIEGFLERTGLSEHAFGLRAMGDHKFVGRLRNGAGITLTVIEKVEAFMDGFGSSDRAA